MVSSFERSIRIAAAIAEERIEAVLDNGVLSMTLPKAVEIEASKKIEIKKK
jgi:HSP20 family molecular chaperone IbpA